MKRLRILVADDLAPEGLEILRAGGEVTVAKGMDEDTLRTTLPPYHALVVRSATRVTRRSLELADHLAVIGRAGIGVDNIDVDAATERGIIVMNTPEAGAVTTGELAIALLVSLARNIPAADAALKAGRWEKSKFTGVELKGKVAGVVGLGRIGRVVAERCRGLDMQVVAYDPFVDQTRAPAFVRMLPLDELLATADFVSIHVPLAPETKHLFDAARIATMKPGARLIHAARGGIVDDAALCDALERGHLGGAALDVFEVEPIPAGSRLLTTRNLVLTPHLGASTAEARLGVSVEMAHQIVAALTRGIAMNGVNVPRIAPADAPRVLPFLELAHGLASFLVQVFDGTLHSLRLVVQGSLPEAAIEPLRIAMATGAMAHRHATPVTPVNALRIAAEHEVAVVAEALTIKRDFLSLLRVEAQFGGERHFVTGTVLGNRHGRMVDFDNAMLDAIPEGPLLVTFHDDRPGMLGRIGTVLGERGVNIARLQLGAFAAASDAADAGGAKRALGIWNLDAVPDAATLAALRQVPGIETVRLVV